MDHPGGVPVIKVKDFPSGEIDERELLRTNPRIAQEYRRSSLRADDILVSIRGTIGRIAVVQPQLAGANITQDTARLSFSRSVSVGFARAVLESASMQRRLYSNIPPPAPAGMPAAKARPRPTIQGLNIGQLRQVLMPIPPMKMQERFAEAAAAARDAMKSAAERLDHVARVRTQAVNRILEESA